LSRRPPSESQPRLVALNAALSAHLQTHGHRFGRARLVTVLSPAVGRLAVSSAALDELITGILDAALEATPPGGTIIVETEQIAAESGLALPDLTLAPGSYALIAVSSVGTETSTPDARTDVESHAAAWSTAARALGGGGWIDVEPNTAIALNVLLPCASGARIRLPNALRAPSLHEGY
jgi:hypothetical protein